MWEKVDHPELTKKGSFCSHLNPQFALSRGTQREYTAKLLKHSIVKRILVFKR